MDDAIAGFAGMGIIFLVWPLVAGMIAGRKGRSATGSFLLTFMLGGVAWFIGFGVSGNGIVGFLAGSLAAFFLLWHCSHIEAGHRKGS